MGEFVVVGLTLYAFAWFLFARDGIAEGNMVCVAILGPIMGAITAVLLIAAARAVVVRLEKLGAERATKGGEG